MALNKIKGAWLSSDDISQTFSVDVLAIHYRDAYDKLLHDIAKSVFKREPKEEDYKHFELKSDAGNGVDHLFFMDVYIGYIVVETVATDGVTVNINFHPADNFDIKN